MTLLTPLSSVPAECKSCSSVTIHVLGRSSHTCERCGGHIYCGYPHCDTDQIINNKAGKPIKYHAEPIKTQLIDNTVVDWLSDGAVEIKGKFIAVRKHDKGLSIILDTGRRVIWAVAESVADEVIRWSRQ